MENLLQELIFTFILFAGSAYSILFVLLLFYSIIAKNYYAKECILECRKRVVIVLFVVILTCIIKEIADIKIQQYNIIASLIVSVLFSLIINIVRYEKNRYGSRMPQNI